MATDQDCEAYARECARLATLTKDPKVREQLMEMAKEWMAVVMGEDGNKTPLTP